MIIIPIIISIAAAAAIGVSVCFAYRILKQQHKLYNSIQLVILKTNRVQYWVAAGILGALAVACFTMLLAKADAVYDFCTQGYGLSVGAVNLIMIMLTLMLLVLSGLTVVFSFAKSAIVDRGIQTPNRFVSWHKLYYYHIDEERARLIFSVSKKGPYTLLGTIGAFSFAAGDIEKIKFILNKNKNKFLKHYDVR